MCSGFMSIYRSELGIYREMKENMETTHYFIQGLGFSAHDVSPMPRLRMNISCHM